MTTIRVSDLLEDESGKMHLGVDYIDVSGDQRHLIVPRAFILEPRRIVSRLLDEGAQLRREDAVADVQAAIDNAPKAPTGLLVNRHGWHGDVYVTKNEVFGDAACLYSTSRSSTTTQLLGRPAARSRAGGMVCSNRSPSRPS